MTPKNTICLWFDTDAHEAARRDDADEEDRCRHHRGGETGLRRWREASC